MSSHERGASMVAVGRYALGWIVAVALAAGAVVGALGALSRDARPAPVADPLALAAQRGECVLRRDAGGAGGSYLDIMQPPTFGPRAVPAAAGVYSTAPRTSAVVASLRRGIIVLQYRRETPRREVLELRRLFALAPFASIVTPDATGMRYAVAATAWGRLLGCPRATRRALDAVRAFARAYRGRGPDASR